MGVPYQWSVFSEDEFDVYLDYANGERNVYARISWQTVEGHIYSDKVVYDLDSTAKREGDEGWKIFGDDDPAADEVVHRMRNDPDVADAILGDVVEDARKIAEASADANIPMVGVFTGFGIHVHQLYFDAKSPKKKMTSTARKFIDEASLRTYDPKIIGDIKRLMRVPNCERVTDDDDRSCGITLIPLTCEEMKDITIEELLEWSYSPRYIDPDLPPRREMVVHPDYTGQSYGDPTTEENDQWHRDMAEEVEVDNLTEYLLEDLLQMPCMYERIKTKNPSHEVRMNSAVLLFNLGFTIQGVHQLFARLGWFDYDPKVTKKQLRQIKQRGYTDMSCASIRAEGLCTRVDHSECPTYGWSGGDHRAEWHKRGDDAYPWFRNDDNAQNGSNTKE